MPRLDNMKNITKGEAQAIIAKALRAYFEDDEQVEVVDIDIHQLDVNVTIWCEDHGGDAEYNVHLTDASERDSCDGAIVVATRKDY
jgi:hypothetical protein